MAVLEINPHEGSNPATRNLLDGLCPVPIYSPRLRGQKRVCMHLKEFAAANRLKTKYTGAEDVIPGKYGELAEMNDGGLLRLRLLAVPRSTKPF